MRAFIAIPLPETTKHSLVQTQNQLKESGADVKWVEPNNIHLTLKFLGDIDDATCEHIKQSLSSVTAAHRQYTIHIGSIGAFPSIHAPRVIWAGVDTGDQETKDIVRSINRESEKLGIPTEERPFSSHITLGRTRSGSRKYVLVTALQETLQDFSAREWTYPVRTIILYKSTLSPRGPLYETIQEFSLSAI